MKQHKAVLVKHDSSAADVAGYVGDLGTWAIAEQYRAHRIADFMNGADPFLVGVARSVGATVVTLELSGGSKKKKITVPDACTHLGVTFENTFEMLNAFGVTLA